MFNILPLSGTLKRPGTHLANTCLLKGKFTGPARKSVPLEYTALKYFYLKITKEYYLILKT